MNRAHSLDALRGYAIVTMILSGTVGSGQLPAWMYHAQVGPRSGFVFDPTIYGITWVDLVFPFFLFAMGAAFPFSLGRKIEKGKSKFQLIFDSVLRGLKLAFFAIFIQHMYPWIISEPENVFSWLVSLSAFVLMFFIFMDMPFVKGKVLRNSIKLAAYVVAVIMMLNMNYANGREFSLTFSNIIILVLANMAIFASIVYILTYKNRIARIAVLPFVMAVLLGSSTENSWVKALYEYSPLPWLYQFYYLKYLFIVIPGTLAGEYLKEWLGRKDSQFVPNVEKRRLPLILILSLSVIVFNLYGLYMRYLVLNLIGTCVLLWTLYRTISFDSIDSAYWKKLFVAGAYLLMLGLFFEAYEGGIRKDHSTYSYYFVTSGLAFIAMISFSVICDIYKWKWISSPLEKAGQNPMVAYVAPQLVVMPLFGLLGLNSFLLLLEQNAFLGLLKGVIITSLSVIVSIVCTRLKWFWRT